MPPQPREATTAGRAAACTAPIESGSCRLGCMRYSRDSGMSEYAGTAVRRFRNETCGTQGGSLGGGRHIQIRVRSLLPHVVRLSCRPFARDVLG